MSLAVIICVYKNDTLDFFKSAIESIPSDVNGEPIHIYLHIDGPLSTETECYINNSTKFHKKIFSEKSIGLAKGLNKILQALENERYIFRMDSDDINNPNRFQCQTEFMDKNSKIELLGGSINEFIGNPKNIVATRQYPQETSSIKKHLKKGSPFAHVTVCFRSSFFKKYGCYPVNYIYNEDIALWFQAVKLGVVATNLKEVLVSVRMDGAYSRRGLSKAWPELKIYFFHNIQLGQPTLYPLLRFLFRISPSNFVETIYNSKIRNKILK